MPGLSALPLSNPLLRLWLSWCAILVVMGSLIRLVIGLWLSDLAQHPEFLKALGYGLLQDAGASLLLSWPLLLAAKFGRNALIGCLCLLIAIVLIVTGAELFFWHEFESRLDRLVFHYLAYPQEVAYFLQDQFYLSLFALPFALLVWLCYWIYRPLVPSANQLAAQPERTTNLWFGLLCAICLLLIGYGKTLHTSDLRSIDQLASNGYLGVLAAARVDVDRWQGYYWQAPQTDGTSIIASDETHTTTASTLAHLKHLIIIIEESFAGTTWQDAQQRKRYLPNIDQLQQQSWYFNNVFATGSRTTRGQEAILNGYPPLPGVAVSQRDGNEHLPALPRALANAGFYTKFVYAGWPEFSGFADYWQNIGFHDSTNRFDFQDGGFETSWGYADETLFGRLLDEMSHLTQEHERVFITTLTVSNHRPYDYPTGRISFPANERRAEYAMAYADWALGNFLIQAATTDWFDDTLFVVVADHGAKFYGSAPIPAASYRVPLLLYAPASITPKIWSHIGSTMSVPSTLLSLMGIADDQGFFGVDLTNPKQRLVPVEHNYNVGLLGPEQLTVLHRGGKLSGWTLPKDEPLTRQSPYQQQTPNQQQAKQAAHLFGQAHKRFYAAQQPAQ